MVSTYLDYNATTPLRPEAKQAMLAVMGAPSNPSSVHHFGQLARAHVEEARVNVAALAGAAPENIIFTSGGTEANHQALHAFPDRVVITTPVEHMAVLASAPEALLIDVDEDGVIDLDHLENLLRSYRGGALVSVMAANNETGVLQPLDAVVRLAREYDALVHSDAVQHFGKGFTGLRSSGVDLMTVSAHKIGGPAGVGALVVRDGLPVPPILAGGGQESRRRGGTENLSGIVGFGAAAAAVQAAGDGWLSQLQAWHNTLEEQILDASDAVVFGRQVNRLANTSAIAMPGRMAETQVMRFDLAGFAVSAGAACSSGKVAASHVLEAMNAGDLAHQTIRVSSGWASTEDDFNRFAEIWLQVYKNQV